tara:strand:- start:2304 stop:3821 length:1518 start_codon:yes stop_codon:yes gene_type:complete
MISISNSQNLNKRPNRWQLIPSEWKEDVDASLLNLLSSNREHVKNLEGQVKELSHLPPNLFLADLESSWYNHNAFFLAINPFLKSLPDNGTPSSRQLKAMQRILDDMILVDTITLLHSLTIKPILERNSTRRIVPFNSFYMDYPLDHYDLMDGAIGLEKIINKYHGGSQELLEQRKKKGVLSRVFSRRKERKEEERLRELKEKMFLEAFYDSYVDRSDQIKALTRISTIDNFDEYRFLYNLEGIEGYYLNDYLIKHNLLAEPQDEGKNLLNYFALKKLMKKKGIEPSKSSQKIPFYTQSTEVSCASACAMMMAHLFYKEPISQRREMEIYSMSRSNVLDGCPFSKISHTLGNLYPQLDIRLVHTTPNLFDKEKVGSLFGESGRMAVDEYRVYAEMAKSERIRIEITKNPEEIIKDTIKQRGVYMAATHLGGGILHSELVTGEEGDRLKIYNPLSGDCYLASMIDFGKRMATPIGMWGIAFLNRNPIEDPEYKSSVEWFKQKKDEL